MNRSIANPIAEPSISLDRFGIFSPNFRQYSHRRNIVSPHLFLLQHAPSTLALDDPLITSDGPNNSTWMNLHKIDYPIGRRLPPATWFVSLCAVSRLNIGTEEHSVGAPRHRSARQRRCVFPHLPSCPSSTLIASLCRATKMLFLLDGPAIRSQNILCRHRIQYPVLSTVLPLSLSRGLPTVTAVAGDQ